MGKVNEPTKEEILEMFTSIMREGTGAAALRAAEILGRYYGLFEDPTPSNPPIIITLNEDGTRTIQS